MRSLVMFVAGAITATIIFGMVKDTEAQIPGSGVQVQGAITPNNCAKWIRNGVIADAGTTC